MNCIDKFVICLAGAMAATTALHAADGAPSGNPYAPVVERNVFGLNPLTVVVPPPADPPVKITPNGIMSIFGHLQVLFKAAGPAQPGKPGGEESYILMEGQRQDDIEVTKINEKAGIVTFNNHGEIQELPLVKASASITPMPAALTPPVQNFGVSIPGGNTGGGFGSRFGGTRNIGGQQGMINNGNNSSGMINNGNNGLNQVNPVRSGNSARLPQNTMAPEDQMILIAAQHAKLQQDGDPTAIISPTTDIDNDAGVVPASPSAAPGPP